MTTATPTYPNDPMVLGSLVANWLDGLEELGFDAGPLIDGLVERGTLERFAARTRWSVVATMLDRSLRMHGPEVTERAGEAHIVRSPLFRAVAHAVRPAAMYATILSGGRHVWPVHTVRAELLGREYFAHLRVPDDQQPAEGWFVTSVGIFRSLPRLVGLPDCEVEASITPTEGRFRAVLPPEALFRQRIAAPRAESLGAILRIVEPYGRRIAFRFLSDLIVASDRADDSPTLVLDLQRHFALTRAEARVAARLASGLSVAAIARALRIQEATVHVHLRRTFRKLGVHRQAELVALIRGRLTSPSDPADARSSATE